MTLSGEAYLVALPVALALYITIPPRSRWAFLLIASYAFYFSFFQPLLPISLISVTVLSYLGGLALSRLTGRVRSLVFGLSIVANLSAIAVIPAVLAGGVHLESHAVEAVGVSFTAFTSITYLADIYLDRAKSETHLGLLALHLAFFAKLTQGPIERAGEFLPQLRRLGMEGKSTSADVAEGFLSIATGLVRKCIIADGLAPYVDRIFDSPTSYAGWPIAAAVYLFALQLYFDFSGYTDIARGSARLFGIHLVPNFDRPYTASSVAEFWRRWHISLSRCIGDFIFSPLQFQLRYLGPMGTALALVAAFAVCGAWHGLTSGFIAWGFLHGTYMAVGVLVRKRQKAVYKRLKIEKSPIKSFVHWFMTLQLVCIAWIPFRTADIRTAWDMFSQLFRPSAVGVPFDETGLFFAVPLALGIAAILCEMASRTPPIIRTFDGIPGWIRLPVAYIFLAAIYLFGSNGWESANFIYAQF